MSPPPRRSERAAERRLSRLLVILPWLMERREVPLAEVAATFKMTPEEVAAELELAAMCGVPTVRRRVDRRVHRRRDGVRRRSPPVHQAAAADGTGRLRPGDRRAGGDAAPGADPTSALGRGLAKLAAALGEDADDSASGGRARGDADGRRVRRRGETCRARAHPLLDGVPRRDHRAPAHAAACVPRARRVVRRRRRPPVRRVPHVPRRPRRVGRAHRRVRRPRRRRRGSRQHDPPTRRSPGRPTARCPRVTVRLQPAARWVVEEYPVDS